MPPRSKADSPAEDVVPAPDAAIDTSGGDHAPDVPTEGSVRLAVGYPHDTWSPFDDDLVLSSDGTDVPVDREADIRAAARQAGVTVRKVK